MNIAKILHDIAMLTITKSYNTNVIIYLGYTYEYGFRVKSYLNTNTHTTLIRTHIFGTIII